MTTPERLCYVDCGLPGDQCACYREMMKQGSAYAAGFKAGIEEDAEIILKAWRGDTTLMEAMEAIRAIPVPDAPGVTLTPDDLLALKDIISACIECDCAEGHQCLRCAALAILDGKKP